MIIKFRIKNFLSIRDEKVLSFEASKNIEKYDQYFTVERGNYKLLKLLAIYGPNASGKTNVLDAITLFRRISVERNGLGILFGPITFAADPSYNKGNTEFGLDFLVEDEGKYIKYHYEMIFNYNNREIILEKLEYYPDRCNLIFERKANSKNERGFDLKIGKSMKLKKSDLDAIESNTLKHTTVLSSFHVTNPIFSKAKNAFEWFERLQQPIENILLNNSIFTNYSIQRRFEESTASRQFLINFLKNADMNITDISINRYEEEVPEKYVGFINSLKDVSKDSNLDISHEMGFEFPEGRKIVNYETTLIHSSEIDGKKIEYSLPIGAESLGTRRIFELAYPLLMALIDSKILVIDEIESSLHFEIIKYYLLSFLSNSEDSQIIFTTHNLLLLDWDILRNDVIWFTEKQQDGATDLFKLTDIKGIERLKVLKQYMAGNLGAFPDIYQYKFNIDSLKEENKKRKTDGEKGKRKS